MSYPLSLDNISTGKTNATPERDDHPAHHNALADAINRLQTELGLSPSGSYDSLTARLDASASGAVHLTAGAPVGSSTLPLASAAHIPNLTAVGVHVVEPWSANCEVAYTQSVAGSTVTLTQPLQRAHPEGALTLYVPSGVFLVDWFGADPTGVADSGPAFQRCLDAIGAGPSTVPYAGAQIVVKWGKGTYRLKTSVFGDSASASLRLAHDCSEAHFVLDVGLLQCAEWNTFCDANPQFLANKGAVFAYFPNTIRPGGTPGAATGTPAATGPPVTAGVVAINNFNAAGPGAKMKPRDELRDGYSTSTLPAPGCQFAMGNQHGLRFRNWWAAGMIGVGTSDGYSDGCGAIGGHVASGPAGTVVKAYWWTDNGDSAVVEDVIGAGTVIGKSHGAVLERGISNEHEILDGAHSVSVRDQHCECSRSGAKGPAGTFRRSSGEVLRGHYNPAVAENAATIPGIFRFACALDLMPNYDAACEWDFRRQWIKTNYFTSNVDDQRRSPDWIFEGLPANAKIRIWYPHPIVSALSAEEAQSSIWLAATDAGTPGGIQAAIDASFILHDPFELAQRNGVWEIRPATRKTVECRRKTSPTIASVVSVRIPQNDLTGGTTEDVGNLPVGSYFGYTAVSRDELGNWALMSTSVGAQALATGRTLQISLTIPQAGCVYLFRGTGADQATANLASRNAPDRCIKLFFQGGTARIYDTGDNASQMPWQLVGVPVPATVAASDHTTSALAIDAGALWPPQLARQSGDLAKTSTVALSDIPGLAVTLEPNGVYEVEAFLVYDGSLAGNAKVGWALPAGADGACFRGPGANITALGTTGQGNWASALFSGTMGLNAGGVGTFISARLFGTLVVGAAGGTLKLQGAQQASDAGVTTFWASRGAAGTAFLRARRIA